MYYSKYYEEDNKVKKLSLLLALVILGFSVCCAEADTSFPLRSGIEFGDTKEEVFTKETTLEGGYSDPFNIFTDDIAYWFTGKIAGYSDAKCTFYFNEIDQLVSMNYSFDDACSSRDRMNNIYETLYQSLTRKYGNSIGNTGGKCELIIGPALDRMILYVYTLDSSDGSSRNYIDYDEWIVDVDNDHVKIDLVSYYWRDNKYNYYYKVDLSYHFYTEAEYQDAINKKRAEREEVDNDL